MYTIKEIAKLAGVGQSTVSRVLNGRPDVSKVTKEKVMQVIEEHSFVPNANAKNLKLVNTNLICIVVRGISNMFFVGIVEKIQRAIEKYGYTPLVHYIDEQEDEFFVARQLITEKKPQGIIFLGGRIYKHEDKIKKLETPCVFATTFSKNANIPNVSSVSIDDKLGAKLAVSKLLDYGHKEIAILGGERKDIGLVHNRYEGAIESMAERSIIFQENRYFESKFSLASAYKAMTKALQQEQGVRMTALFAMSDIMAVGAQKAILDFGKKIPEDISLVGFDGIELTQYMTPTLATVKQPAEAIATKSVEVLVHHIKGKSKGIEMVLDVEFISGNSIATIC